MVYHDESEIPDEERVDENRVGKSPADIAGDDWADALIISWENEGKQIDGDDFDGKDIPKAVLDDMKRKLNKALAKRRMHEDDHQQSHRSPAHSSETVRTKERQIQRITAEVCRQLRIQMHNSTT
jgi:hypothetical protein